MAQDLRKIHDFPDLVRYLEEELDWPLRDYGFDELTFEFTPGELGLKEEDAARIKTIHQLRPLASRQPWGIFFVEFENKKLPVVVLRRILSHLAIKKRASANKATTPAWHEDDLLFITAFGEDGTDAREIAIAHFHQNQGEIPTLHVLGWDGGDTPLKLANVDHILRKRLHWPDDISDAEAWRKTWSQPFRHRIGHTIQTSSLLAEELARLARGIREKATLLLSVESEKGGITKLYKAFKTALIHDLTPDSFADTYAQTITYGLLTAAISRTEINEVPQGTALFAEDIVDMVPVTNPFLKEMLQTFLKVGGRKDGIDFDELGIQDVVELLRSQDTDLPAILRDFGNRTRGEDPVIHFYEHFLHAYNKQLKIQRGVFYTPQPVVSYIVRSVHELLQTEFDLEDGLASTITWGEMLKKHPNLKLPPLTDAVDEKCTISADEPFVLILDPATGTATFLVEVIDVIYQTLTEKWNKQNLSALQQISTWNDYVPKHLLPRLHGYELMMAPYAIAHMKIGLKLAETGYHFDTDERVHIYLTNALEPWQRQLNLPDFEALAHEATAVNEIKRDKRFTVVIGNPPYSHWSANLETHHRDLVDPYKYVHGERIRERGALQFELNIQDDYVKFIRIAEIAIENSKIGIAGLITNNAYLDSATFRGLRAHLLDSYDAIRILDLHGSIKAIREKGDENVFDIQQGVAISISSRLFNRSKGVVNYTELVGSRDSKYSTLIGHPPFRSKVMFDPSRPSFLFLSRDETLAAEYEAGLSVNNMFKLSSSGIKTNRDGLTIAFDQSELINRMEVFLDPVLSDDQVADALNIEDKKYWNIEEARRQLTRNAWIDSCTPVEYRPFDERQIVYHKALVFSPRYPVMSHLCRQDNLALLLCRQQIVTGFFHAFVTRGLFDCCLVSNRSRENTSGFPLFVTNASDRNTTLFEDQIGLSSNLTPEVTKAFRQNGGQGSEISIFNYIYAVLHNSQYRERYAKFLQRDFPRIPLPGTPELFSRLAHLGGELTSVHLMESPKLTKFISAFIGESNLKIEIISWSQNTVWMNKAQTTGFQGVSEDVWNFSIGSYQVCQKWLKDRKGRTLSTDDIDHYRMIVVALSETIRLMAEIDKVIEQHGGWPGAFDNSTG